MAADPTNLTHELVIEAGGWHPMFARVLLIVADEDVAFALVDGNGDGAELEMEYWSREDTVWTPGVSSGHGPLDMLKSNRWDAGSMVCAVGHGVPGESVRVGYDGEVIQCPVNPFGLWGFVRKVEGMDVKHPLPELLDGDADAAQARVQMEAQMDVARERIRRRLLSRRPPTA
ncbi:MAG TPA: hypothetical protein VLX59_07275 [Acidimicrobiales bacterium]|nr:hypothetical protein [Acidimicrobiales bacterium]